VAGNGPPKDADPTDLWQRLSTRPRPSKVVPFPVPPGEESPGDLALVVLTESEMMQVRANADAAAKEALRGDIKPGDLGYEDLYENEKAVQLVALAARKADDPTMLRFPSAKDLRKKLTTDEIGQIAADYTQFRLERGPFVSELTEPELEAWLKVLQEGASRVPFSRLRTEALIDLVMFLGSKVTQLMASGSAGSPPEGSSTDPVAAPVDSLIDESEKARSE